MRKNNSIIDYPHKTLDPKIWDIDKDPPVLRENIKEKILSVLYEGLKSFGYIDPESLFRSIHIVGSIGTKFYLPWSDIDVHLIPSENVVDYIELQEILREELSGYKIDLHPVNYYLQTDEIQELKGDALYILNNDTWIIYDKKKYDEFDPYKEYESIWSKAQEIMNDFVLDVEELRRDIKDVDILKQYVEELDEDQKKWLEEKIKEKLNEIDEDLEQLSDKFTEVHKQRKKSYEMTPEEVLNEIDYSRTSGNVLWKFIERYGWVSLLHDLREVYEDTEDEKKQYEEVKDVLKDYDMMLEK